MGRIDRIRPYVEKLLEEGFGIPDLKPDEDGDYPFRFRSAGYYVRLINESAPTLQLFSIVVRDIKRTAKLLAALNDINSRASFARVYWTDSRVVVATELVAETLDAQELGNACNVVGQLADAIGTGIVAEFGGKLLFEESPPGTEAPVAAPDAKNAGYL